MNKINEILLRLGCRPNNIGYRYLNDIICMAVQGISIAPLSLYGYKILAEKYKKSINSIEKNIQNCINSAWLNGDEDFLYEYFGETISDERGKPTNKHFIFSIVEKLSA